MHATREGKGAIGDCRAAQRLCARFEDVLRHGLKVGWFGQNTSFWPVVLNISRKQAIAYINRLVFTLMIVPCVQRYHLLLLPPSSLYLPLSVYLLLSLPALPPYSLSYIFLSLQYAQSESGRCRAWIRLAVNECSLESYISVLHQDASLLGQYYDTYSFLRNAEMMSALQQLLVGLSQLTFNM